MEKAAEIRREIQKVPKGRPFTVGRFFGFASRTNVYQVVSRWERQGELKRVSRGVYIRPKTNPYVGTVMPSVEEVVKVLASAAGATVQVHGAEAARRLGLTTQVPTRPMFYTSGASRRFKIGGMSVELRHVGRRRLTLAERTAGLAISALLHLGEKRVSGVVVAKIKARLPKQEYGLFKEQMPQMPAWMARAVNSYEQGELCGA